MEEITTVRTDHDASPTPFAGTTAPAVIRVRDLEKHYGSVQAVRGVSFDIGKSEIFGLIGPDGAGKTTTFQIIAGVMEASSGSVEVFGRPAIETRSQTGYLTQTFSLYPDLTVAENLRYMGDLRLVPADEIVTRGRRYLEMFGMERFEDRLAGKLSGGMKQKLALACALVPEPSVLLLDEPTTGVDPVSRREFWDTLAHLAADGLTILVATPYLDEAERCHRVALIYRGQIQHIGTPDEVRSRLHARRLELRTANLSQARQAIAKVAGPDRPILDVQRFGDRIDVLEPTAGSMQLAGERGKFRSENVRQQIGYMSQKFSLYDDLSIRENLEFFAGVYGVAPEEREEKIKWVLSFSGLEGKQNQITGSLPGGWKQRVAFGAATMHEPPVLFLDEPTSGVDPLARRAFWNMINRLADSGAAVLVTTHYLEEAEQCNRLGFMIAGELLVEGAPSEIKSRQEGKLWEFIVDQPQRATDLLKKETDRWRVSLFGNRLHVITDDGRGKEQTTERLSAGGIRVISAREERFSLEDVFISMVEKARQQGKVAAED